MQISGQKRRALSAALFVGLALLLPTESLGADQSRGALLYDTHCQSCHATNIHWRQNSVIKTRADLVRMVDQWREHLHLDWTSDMVNDVVRYLNRRHYKLNSGTV